MKTTKQIHTEVTEKIIASLQKGVAPWVRPWDSSLTDGLPTNFLTKKAYRGINTVILDMEQMAKGYERCLWLTYKQAAELGGQVRKGEKSVEIYRFQVNQVERENDYGETELRRYPMLKIYWVFNVAQIDGLDLPDISKPSAKAWAEDKKVEAMAKSTGAVIKHGGDRACFIPSKDEVHMPTKAQFKTKGDYYATLIHELVHWTGHKSRLDRLTWAPFGGADYAKEELVAEMGSAFLSARYKLDGKLQHASYIQSWLKALENDHSLIFQAASKAQKACDYLLGVKFEADEEKQAA